jgi:hypothetical protein
LGNRPRPGWPTGAGLRQPPHTERPDPNGAQEQRPSHDLTSVCEGRIGRIGSDRGLCGLRPARLVRSHRSIVGSCGSSPHQPPGCRSPSAP